MPKDDLIGSREACELLVEFSRKPDAEMLDRSTLSRWVALGKLTPALRLPGDKGAMLFHRADVLDLRATMRAEAAQVAS